MVTAAGKHRSARKQYRWEYRGAQPESALRLSQDLNLSPVIARVLANRGLADCPVSFESFVRPVLSSLHDPFQLADMDRAISRIMVAVQKREKVTVFGDYDTDGATSTAVMLRTLRFVGLDAEYYIPHRIDEGYGLNSQAIEQIRNAGTSLLITVDNGISGLEQIEFANRIGLEVIVTDHHQPGSELPPALAVVNPSRRDCLYPNRHLTGVGVAFKLAHALLKSLKIPTERALPFLRSLLDLVAIGTVADFAPLVGENRVLVSHGLDQMRRSANMGVQELVSMLELQGKPVTTQHIGFQIAPRLNAAGRTNHAGICVELLVTDDRARAAEIACQLDGFNKERRGLEAQIFEQCLTQLESQPTDADRVIVACGSGWHLGVVGIVASRIMDMFGRPAIVLSETNGCAKGSARSTGAFNIHEALEKCSNLLTGFGGHPNAAGLHLDKENVQAFREAINSFAQETCSESDMTAMLLIDTEVHSHELDDALARDLSMMEPYGHQNPAPLLSVKSLRIAEPPRIVGTNHLRAQFKHEGRVLNAIGFNQGYRVGELSANRNALLDAAFTPSINTYWGDSRVELEIKDLRFHVSDG